jgi:hypothetical protein
MLIESGCDNSITTTPNGKTGENRGKQVAVRVNVQTFIAFFPSYVSCFKPGQENCQNGRKYEFNSVIDRQIHTGITL